MLFFCHDWNFETNDIFYSVSLIFKIFNEPDFAQHGPWLKHAQLIVAKGTFEYPTVPFGFKT
jgi:hypothetical protein